MYNWNIELFRHEMEEIVNIDSGTSFTEGVGTVGRTLAAKFEAEGFTVKEYDDFTRLEIRTHKEEDFDILLIGHMDTVFPVGTVAARPYTEKDGFAYGPGVADMKSGLIAILHLMRRFREEKPDLKICAALNGDEETGSYASKDWLRSLAGHGRYAFVFEPGRNGTAFVRSRKGCMDIMVKFHGIASHAGGAPEKGANAITEMARWITELTALQNLAIGTSVSAGLVKGGTASNVIPDYAEVIFDIRITDINEMEKIRNKAAELAQSISVPGVTADVLISSGSPPMTPSAATLEIVEKMNAAAEELGIEISWVDTGGVSDANNIAPVGIPVLCGCGPVGGDFHSEKEFLDISSIEKRLNLMYNLLSAL